MHGIWLLVFAPLAALIAWRYSSLAVRKIAFWLMIACSIALVGWFGYLSFEGSESATAFYDRGMCSLGVIIGAINMPILQLILALVIVVLWPRKFEFAKPQ